MEIKNLQHNDDVASRIEWTLISTSSSNFDSRKLVIAGSNIIYYKLTLQAKLFGSAFILMGGSLFVITVSELIKNPIPITADIIGGKLAMLLFVAIGVGFLYHLSSPIKFDKKLGMFSKGRKSGKFAVDRLVNCAEVNLRDIYSIQLLSGAGMSDYTNYQLNLVTRSSERVHIVYYSDRETAKSDAITLAKFLDVKLWDVT